MRQTLLFVMLLSGCASLPPAGNPEALFDDALFAPPAQPVDPARIFAVTEPMRQFASSRIATRALRSGPRAALVEALRQELAIDYDAQKTRTAAETFEARSGNCLSLVLLTGALARQLDIPVTYQSIHGYDTWSRSGGIAFLSGHVNVVLGWRGSDATSLAQQHELTVDFLPEQARRFSARTVPESTVVAMYLNNRAAEILAGGDVDEAYWWARAAVRAEPRFVSAQNTLAVVYMRRGANVQAQRALAHALERERANPQILANLVTVLTRLGRDVEAAEMSRRLARIEPYPPFHFLDQGLAAMERGDPSQALVLFRRELRRMPYDDELHFAMAMADVKLGRLRSARRHMSIAVEYSLTLQRQQIYANKLKHLEQVGTN